MSDRCQHGNELRYFFSLKFFAMKLFEKATEEFRRRWSISVGNGELAELHASVGDRVRFFGKIKLRILFRCEQ